MKDEKQRRISAFDACWKTALESIKEAVTSKVKLSAVVENTRETIGKYDGFIPNWLAAQVHAIDYGSFVCVPAPYRLNVLDGTYVSVAKQLSNTLMIDSIADHIDSEVDCLVEFGSGLGLNLARMRLRLPHANLCYVACEPSENGRLATKSLFSLDPNAELRTQYFDYLATNLDFLRGFRKIVAFTCHSIEQIVVLGEDFYDRLLNTNVHACIHCEPIGWQRSAGYYDAVLKIIQNHQLHRQFRQNYTFVLSNENLLANAAVWAAICRYNIDLMKLVSGAVNRGDVTITGTAYDFVGINPFNPSTLVSWVTKHH
jgi:hypothetical protein